MTMSQPPRADAGVVIVGAGPVGAVLALELAHHGVPSTVLERSVEATRHPKMDFLNARSMELLRRLALHDALHARGVPPDQDLRFLWTRSLAGDPVDDWSFPSAAELGRLMAKTNDGTLPREPYLRVIGSTLEEIVRAQCRESPLIDLLEGWKLVGFTQDDTGVDIEVSRRGGGTERIRARWLVGCDGANSVVREAAGIGADQLGPVTQNVNVYFRSGDPALVRHGRYFLAVGASGLTLVSRDGADTWTGVFPRPGAEPFTGDPVPFLRRAAGLDFEVDEVLSVANWENKLSVAGSYRAGRVFLCGDAAHQYFPSGGHGANTGLADAVDLGWKLAAQDAGWGGVSLLDSYEAERRPVALFNREMCFNLMEVWRRFMFLNRDGASDVQLAGYLEHQRYQGEALGIHAGYRYRGSPVIVQDGSAEPRWSIGAIVPTTWPGSRAPSVRLLDATEIYDRLGQGFTLVDFSTDGAGAPLAAAAGAAGIPLRHLRLDDPPARAVWERDLVLVRPDHHVAWRGDAFPADPQAVLRQVTGR